jgi:hypothetical protein
MKTFFLMGLLTIMSASAHAGNGQVGSAQWKVISGPEAATNIAVIANSIGQLGEAKQPSIWYTWGDCDEDELRKILIPSAKSTEEIGVGPQSGRIVLTHREASGTYELILNISEDSKRITRMFYRTTPHQTLEVNHGDLKNINVETVPAPAQIKECALKSSN